MYQACTSTTVSDGHQRSLTDARELHLSRPDDGYAGAFHDLIFGLITRTSRMHLSPQGDI